MIEITEAELWARSALTSVRAAKAVLSETVMPPPHSRTLNAGDPWKQVTSANSAIHKSVVVLDGIQRSLFDLTRCLEKERAMKEDGS